MTEPDIAPAALIVESMRKAAVVWLTDLPGQPTGRSTAAWCCWLDDALYVVSGAGEQPVPGLGTATSCTVSGRGDNGARIVVWPAAVHQLAPGGQEWERVVPHLVGKRLNLPAGDDTPARWARDCTVAKLTPCGAPEPLPTGSLATQPPGPVASAGSRQRP